MSSIAQKLVSGSILRVINLIASLSVAFFMTPFIIHSIGDKMYGFWVLVATFIGYYGLLDLGLSNAIGRHMSKSIGAKDPKESNRVFNTGFTLFLVLGLLVLLVTFIIIYLAKFFVESPNDISIFRIVLLILGVHTAIDFPMRVFHGILHAKLRFELASFIGLLNLFIRTVLIIIALKFNYQLVGLAFASLVANIVPNILYVYFVKKISPEIRFNLACINKKTVKTLFSYSVFIFLLQIAAKLRFHTDGFVITAFVGLSAFAHYSIAGMLIQYFGDLMGRIMGVLTPYFSQLDGAGDSHGILKTLFLTTKVSVAISSFIGFGFIAWGKPFIERWMGNDYLDAYPCLVILVFGVIFSFWQLPSITLLFGISKHKFLAIIAFVEGLANLFLSLILVKYYGLIGVALGTSIPLILNKVIIQPIYVCKVSSIPYVEYLMVLLRSFFAVIVSLIPCVVVLKFAIPNYFYLINLAVFSFMTYLIGVWFLLLSQEERQTIKRMFFYNFFKKK